MTAPDRVLPVATGEMLLVAVVVAIGFVVVVLTLPIAEETTESGPVAAVDAVRNGSAIDVCHQDGDVIAAADLEVRYPHPDAGAIVRPFTSGVTDDADPATFSAGECRTFDPPAERGGDVRIVVRHEPTNLTLLDERVQLGGTSAVAQPGSAVAPPDTAVERPGARPA